MQLFMKSLIKVNFHIKKTEHSNPITNNCYILDRSDRALVCNDDSGSILILLHWKLAFMCKYKPLLPKIYLACSACTPFEDLILNLKVLRVLASFILLGTNLIFLSLDKKLIQCHARYLPALFTRQTFTRHLQIVRSKTFFDSFWCNIIFNFEHFNC